MIKLFVLLTPRLLRDLRDALHFLTRLPVPGTVSRRNLRDAIGAFPLAGAVLGAVLALLDTLLAILHVPVTLRSALIIAAWCWLTDAMHLEGLIRVAAQLVEPSPQPETEQAGASSGTPGMAAAAFVLLVKVVLLSMLHGPARLEILVVAPMLGRWSLALAAALFPSSAFDGFDRRRVNPLRLAEAAVITLTLTSFAGGRGMIALIVCSAVTARLGRMLVLRLPEHTGDCYGALVEVTEAVALFVFTLGVTGLWSPF